MSIPVFLFGGKKSGTCNFWQLLRLCTYQGGDCHIHSLSSLSGKYHCFGGLGATAWGPGHADPHVAAKVAANHSTTSFSPESLCQLIELNQLKNGYGQNNGRSDTIRETERQPGGQTSREMFRKFKCETSVPQKTLATQSLPFIASIAPFVLFAFLVPIRVIPCWLRASRSHTLPQCYKNAIISQIFVDRFCESMSNRPARYPRPSGCQCNLLLTKKPGGFSKKMPKRQPKKKLGGF